MSSRQTGFRYGLGGNSPSSGGSAAGQGLGNLLAMLLGQNTITGGPQQDIDPETGQPTGDLTYAPFQGKGKASIPAAQLNAILGGQVLQQQATSRLSRQQAQEEQTRLKLANELETNLLNSKQVADMATKYGIPVTELKNHISDIADGIASNLVQQNKNIGQGLRNPDVQKATQEQLIAEAQAQDAQNRQRLQLGTGMGGVNTMPGPLGSQPTTVTGATPRQTTQLLGTGPRDPKTGMPIMQTPVTTSDYNPASVSIPGSDILSRAAGITPGGTNATPQLATGMPGASPALGGTNAITSGVGQGQPQYNAPIGPQRLNTGLIPNAARTIGQFYGQPIQQMMGADKDAISQLIQLLWTGNGQQ